MFHVHDTHSSHTLQYYPMFVPSPVFMSTIAAHFNRVCRFALTLLCMCLCPYLATPLLCNLQHSSACEQLRFCITTLLQSCTARAPGVSSGPHTSQPTFRRFRSVAALAGSLPLPSQRHLVAAGIEYFATQSFSFWQAKTAQSGGSDSDTIEEGDFIAVGSSCTWMQR